VLWTDDPGDKVISKRLLTRINNGGIILIHDGVQQTLDVLPRIITYLKKREFEFVTIDQMLQKGR